MRLKIYLFLTLIFGLIIIFEYTTQNNLMRLQRLLFSLFLLISAGISAEIFRRRYAAKHKKTLTNIIDEKVDEENEEIRESAERILRIIGEKDNIIETYEQKINALIADKIKNNDSKKVDFLAACGYIYEDICDKEETIKKYQAEVENYKQELSNSYNNLLAKSTEIEYQNSMLERRIAKLSALNAVGKAVLSELEMDKIISTILDSYFVLVSAKKIMFYLWEGENLIQKAMRGGASIREAPYYPRANIRGGKDSIYYEKYLEIAEKTLDEDEVIIIAELKVKGKELGVLFITESKEGEGDVKKEEMEMISALNIYASIAINNAKVYKELSDKQRLEKEVGIARGIQMNLLPKDVKSVFGLEISNHFEPAREVGGDYYDYFISAEGKFGIAIGDVSGKGMPAALLMTTVRAILRTIASYDLLPDIALTRLNNVVFQDINEEMFVTLFYSLYDYETATLFFSNAGHNPLIIFDAQEEKIYEKNIKGTAIGFAENYNYKLDKLKLNTGDVVIFYTDGITEAENSKGEMFGVDRLKAAVDEYKDLSSEKIKKGILEKIEEFRGDFEQVDDITLVVLKYKGWI